MLTTVNVQNNINATKYGSLVAIGDAEGTVTLIELCESLYEPQSNEKLSIKQMLEREYAREKNLKAAKRLTEGRRTGRRDETTIGKQKEKQAEKLRKLEADFFAQVGIVGEEAKHSGKKEEETPVPQKAKPVEISNRPVEAPKPKVEPKVENIVIEIPKENPPNEDNKSGSNGSPESSLKSGSNEASGNENED